MRRRWTAMLLIGSLAQGSCDVKPPPPPLPQPALAVAIDYVTPSKLAFAAGDPEPIFITYRVTNTGTANAISAKGTIQVQLFVDDVALPTEIAVQSPLAPSHSASSGRVSFSAAALAVGKHYFRLVVNGDSAVPLQNTRAISSATLALDIVNTPVPPRSNADLKIEFDMPTSAAIVTGSKERLEMRYHVINVGTDPADDRNGKIFAGFLLDNMQLPIGQLVVEGPIQPGQRVTSGSFFLQTETLEAGPHTFALALDSIPGERDSTNNESPKLFINSTSAVQNIVVKAHGASATVEGRVADGRVVWGQDIDATMPEGAARNAYVSNADVLWPGGVVYYDDVYMTEDATYAPAWTAAWTAATTGPQGWQTLTNNAIRFVRRTNEPNFIGIIPTSDPHICGSSAMGMQFAGQALRINKSCKGAYFEGTIRHELGHALGLFHEHQRRDRAQFINVLNANVDKDKCPNFDTDYGVVNLEALLSGLYDLTSVMHYSSGACALPKTNVLVPIAGGTIPDINTLSTGDICSVLQAYNTSEYNRQGCNQAGTVANCRRNQGPFSWSCSGQVGPNCIQISEPKETTKSPSGTVVWSDNYLCGTPTVSLVYSSNGAASLPTLTRGCEWRCAVLNEEAEPAPNTWSDNLLCEKSCSNGFSGCFHFQFSQNGPISGKACLQLFEPEDSAHTWTDNYLCWESQCGAGIAGPP